MKAEKLKCPKCGYIFEGNVETDWDNCPLCNNEYKTSEALKLFEDSNSNISNKKPKEKTTPQIILEWLAFFGAFAVFIVVLYMIINYILGA